MLFHSLQFLLFLPITMFLYWSFAQHATARKVILVVASLIFYMAWNPAPVVLLLYLTLVDWAVGVWLAKVEKPSWRKAIVALSIVNNLFLLGLFKYADWITKSVVDAAGSFGIELVYKPLGLLLPVGLSFIVFQGMSYTIDVYRRELRARPSLLDVAVFMTFFPHVVAGPIVRASDFLPQIEERPRINDDIGGRALFRILTGMVKKLVFADFLAANLVDRVFADPGNHTGLEVMVGIVAYTLQIYYDFSAYSDIAIGTAALFGYVLKENFDKPYLSPNLFEFWRRWHMSLGSWLRDYLYVPLGGNRSSKSRTLTNLMITMVLGGVWHGADWRFVAWGLTHGIGLSLTRIWWWTFGKPKAPSIVRTVVCTLLTFLLVVELRIVFRAKDLSHAADVFLAQADHWGSLAAPALTWPVLLCLGVAMAGHLCTHGFYDRVAGGFARLPVGLRIAVMLGAALLTQQVASAEAQPFIYFKF
ncbi:MAG: MBOAT family O-acyltransferase [Deltaproteobacteria bacterium]|nr:MBOAT family O-acyltransferase [Deltaproteobacteria bacterium]